MNEADLESYIVEFDAIARLQLQWGPVLINVEGICIAVSDEVLHQHVRHVSAAAIGFDHHHLVGVDGVDVSVVDIGDIDAYTK